MSKFVMECPGCGKYVAAKTGVFARRKIECDCGHTIHVKTDKLTARTCPHCGNVFAYDQSEGKTVRCPVCRNKVVTTSADTKTTDFSCEQCFSNAFLAVQGQSNVCTVRKCGNQSPG